MKVKYSTKDLELIKQKIKQVIQNFPREAGDIIVDDALDNFEKESFNNTKWEPRKRDNSANEDRSERRALLVQDGHLRRSIRVGKVTATSVEVGSDVEYAPFHQNSNPSRNLPARPFLGVTPALKIELMDHLKLEISKTLK